MRHILLYTILLLAAALHAAPSEDVARGLLHADGILTVQGGSTDEALITVIPAHAPSYTLKKGTSKFVLELELNSSYMVTFEHPRCLTKQLHFDTNVPDDYKLDEYSFPFEVVLEVESRVEDRSYVGPVGHIRYMEMVNDFDYETDYTLKIDDRIKKRMAEAEPLRYEDALPVASSTGTRAPAKNTIGTEENNAMETPTGRPGVTRVGADTGNAIVAALPEVAVEREAAPEVIETISSTSTVELEERPAPVQIEVVDVPVRTTDVIETPPTGEVRPTVEKKPSAPTTVLPTSKGATYKYDLPDPSKFGREEEMIVEDNKVTTIVRIVNEQGYAHEYRRVAHKFGPVFYFKDEQSIPDHMYYDDTGLPRQ